MTTSRDAFLLLARSRDLLVCDVVHGLFFYSKSTFVGQRCCWHRPVCWFRGTCLMLSKSLANQGYEDLLNTTGWNVYWRHRINPPRRRLDPKRPRHYVGRGVPVSITKTPLVWLMDIVRCIRGQVLISSGISVWLSHFDQVFHMYDSVLPVEEARAQDGVGSLGNSRIDQEAQKGSKRRLRSGTEVTRRIIASFMSWLATPAGLVGKLA